MLKIVCYIFIIFISSTIIEGKYLKLKLTQFKPDDVCRTEGCKQAGDLIKNNMNSKVKPCDDFYEFACGGFISSNTIPANKNNINEYDKLEDITSSQIISMLSEDIEKNEIAPFQMAKQFFQDCTDETTLESVGINPIIAIIKRVGEWPLLNPEWDEKSFSWIETTEKARKMGFTCDYILSLNAKPHFRDAGMRITYVEPPKFEISVIDLKEGKSNAAVMAYYEVMKATVGKLGVDTQKTASELSDLLSFEVELAQTLPTKEEWKKDLFPITVHEAQTRFPFIQWEAFVQSMLNPFNVSLSRHDKFVLPLKVFMLRLENLLKSVPKRVLANYMMWRMLFSLLNKYLSKKEPRRKSCAHLAAKKLNLAVASMYVRKFVKKETKQRVIEITTNVRDQLGEMLNSSKWLDETSRQNVFNKTKEIKFNIAYHEIVSDDGKLIEIYRGLKLIPGQFYESLLLVEKFNINLSLSTLYKPRVRDDWLAYGDWLSTEAYYEDCENNIKISAALLKKHMFELDRPSYLNYGAIGSVIGHELSHAFDSIGRLYNETGHAGNMWTAETAIMYNKKINCFVQQYNKYILDGTSKRVNGKHTKDENVADEEGLRAAYDAYRRWILKYGDEPALPNLEFTPRQLFWISFANIWCSKYNKKHLELALKDVHSPDKIRVIGSLSNLETFAEDFNCPVGSRMNPKDKCSLWI